MISIYKARAMMGFLALSVGIGIAGIVSSVGADKAVKTGEVNENKPTEASTLYSSTEDIEGEVNYYNREWLPKEEIADAYEKEVKDAIILVHTEEDDSFMNVEYVEPTPEPTPEPEVEEVVEVVTPVPTEIPEPTPEPTAVPTKPAETPSVSGTDLVAAASDEALLTCIVATESGYDYDEMLAVASVVINRCNSKGASMYSVVTAPYQFSVYSSGILQSALEKYNAGNINESAHNAAVYVLNNGPTVSYGGFRMYYQGIENDFPDGEKIGTTWFHN